jgi:hypothetical protein
MQTKSWQQLAAEDDQLCACVQTLHGRGLDSATPGF